MNHKTIETYIKRSKLPAVKNRYMMRMEAMDVLIEYGEADARQRGLINGLWSVASLAYSYGMAAGYRMGTKYKGGTT